MTECELSVNGASDIECVWVRKLPLVSIGRPIDQQHLVCFVHRLTMNDDRADERPGQRLDRRVEAEAFLDGSGKQGRVGDYGPPLVWVLTKEEGAVRSPGWWSSRSRRRPREHTSRTVRLRQDTPRRSPL